MLPLQTPKSLLKRMVQAALTAMKYCLMKTDTIQLFSVSIVIQSKLTDMILNLQLLTLQIHHLKITIM